MSGILTPEHMAALMKAVDKSLNPGLSGKDRQIGIVMLVFPFGATDGQANYISNGAERRDIIAFLRETAARLESAASHKAGHA